MSKIKHYDSTLKKWVVDGASNASNIELSNAGYVDDKGNSISVDEGFTKVYNKLMKHENNLAWVYLNGAKGGGGGSGSSDSYTLTVKEGNTVYTTNNSATLTLTISGGTTAKRFTVALYNYATNKLVTTYSIVSKKEQTITITDISATTKYAIQAYDSSQNTTDTVYVTIVAGAISLKLTSAPSNVMYIGASTALNAIFTVVNNIGQSATTFVMTCSVGSTAVELIRNNTITESTRQLSYNIRDLISNNSTLAPLV